MDDKVPTNIGKEDQQCFEIGRSLTPLRNIFHNCPTRVFLHPIAQIGASSDKDPTGVSIYSLKETGPIVITR